MRLLLDLPPPLPLTNSTTKLDLKIRFPAISLLLASFILPTPQRHLSYLFTKYIRLLSKESEESSSGKKDQEPALAKGVECMKASMEASTDFENKRDKQREYALECREKCFVPEVPETPSTTNEIEVIQSIQERTIANVPEEIPTQGPEYK